ncbi:cadherin-like beta sandwich domain-containing protein [Maribellus mangrovi]|uniref:cadherin-like beta sandwich domain-containing protein n=1 Tax=Maribellus mangrovi TaxID=3133146 RepID=UPI0030EC5FF1
MRNSTFKILMMACMVFIAGFANGQVKLENRSQIGQTYVRSLETQQAVLDISFNTDQATSTWTQVNDSTVEFSWGKAQNSKGFAVTVWDGEGNSLNPNDDFKVRSGRWRNNENPNHVASVDSLQALLAKWEEVYAGTADSAKNTLNNHSACLFDVGGDPANQAYGVHPGIYKKLEHEFVFSFKNLVLKSDLQFTIDTYDEGNTGATATYDLRVKFGSVDETKTSYYTTGSGLKTVNLAEAFGMDLSDLNGQSEVHVYLSTNGTGTAIAEGSYDPTIIVDDFTVTFAAPVWVEPNMGLDGGNYSNEAFPFMAYIGEETMVKMPLKMKGRVAPIKITDNLYKNGSGDKFNKMLTFLDTLAVMANDGNGNYTVEVPYTFTPATLDPGTMEWTNQSIEIAAPDSAVDTDLMFYFKVLGEEVPYYSNMEIDAGVRIFYQAHVYGMEAPQEWNISTDDFNGLGELTSDTTVNGFTIYAADDKKVTIDDNNKSVGGMDFTYRLKLGGSGRFVDGMPDARVLAFDVKGNTTITIAGMSSNSSSDRLLYIAAGSEENVIDSFPALGTPITMKDFSYVGEATTIYMWSPSSGVNIYYLKAAPMTPKKVAYITADKELDASAAASDDDPIIRMLKADPNFFVDVKVVADDATVDLEGYDVVVAQEGFGSSSDIFKPGGSLGLENIEVPFIYNKAYALRDGKAVTSAGAATSEVAGQLYLEVPDSSQMSELFSGITFDGDSVMIFKTGATDDGVAGEKAFSYTTDLEMSDAATLLGQPKGAAGNVSICFNDIPAGTVLGTEDTLQARMIHISENYGAICKDGGDNLTAEGITIWRNALYMAAGLEVPTTLLEDVATLDTLYASEGELSPMFDAEKTAYSLVLPKGTSSVEFMAMATSEMAMVTVPEAVSLSDGMNTEVSVEVMSPLGTKTMTYTIYIHVQSEKEILYLSASGGIYADAKAFDTNVYDGLVDAGYSVTFAPKGAIFEWTPDGIMPFDYSPYVGMVIGGGESSSNVNDYAKRNYPIPCVSMQNDGPKSNKWGWVNDKNAEQHAKTKTYDAVTAQMKVTNNSHYITEIYDVDEVITWTSGTAESEDFLGKEIKSYDLTDSVPDAIPLVTIPADGTLLTTMWAVPAGSSVRSMNGDYDTYERVTTASNVVLLYLFNDGLLYATESFDTLLVRSLQWVLGEDTNAKLESLTASEGDIVQSFDPDKTEYQLNLPMGTSAVSLTAVPQVSGAMVTVPEELTLSDGMTEMLTVKVVSSGKSDSMMYNVMVHVQTDEEILYVSSSSGVYNDTKAFDTNVYDALVDAGYSVTFAKKNELFEWSPEGIMAYDYSPYMGMVISAGAGSDNTKDYAKRNYPIPCVTMQPDGPRSNKFGWVENDKMYVTKVYDEHTAQMVVLNNQHYITQNFNVGDSIMWSSGTATSEDFLGKEVKSYDLSEDVTTAIPLATIPADGNTLTTMWAIPKGSTMRSLNGEYDNYETVNNPERVVFMSLFNDGLLYATAGFDTMLVRSLEWVLGAGGTVDVPDVAFENDVVLYPNPAQDHARIRFSVERTQEVSLSLYNMVGQKIEISSPQVLTEGVHEIAIPANRLNDGMYIYLLQVGSEAFKGKLNIVR